MLKKQENYIGAVGQLVNGGNGILFFVIENGQDPSQKVPAFAVRFNDVVRAFKNRCGHIAVNLDFKQGHFFNEEGEFLVCSTHGALYEPSTGACQGGPCYGVGLEPLTVVDCEGDLYLDDESVMLVKETS